jgi:hypothetical protein
MLSGKEQKGILKFREQAMRDGLSLAETPVDDEDERRVDLFLV